MKIVLELDEINDDNWCDVYCNVAEAAKLLIKNGYRIELSISKKTYQWFLEGRHERLRLPKTLFGYSFRVRHNG